MSAVSAPLQFDGMPGDDAPHWKQFERLAETIFAELLPFAEVKWNDHLLGQYSKRRRQIDVSIRSQVAGQPVLVVVQAKDTNEPVDIGVVDAFTSVVRDVQATKGILVCRSGFDPTVYAYARSTGIELLGIHDAESKRWRREISIPILWIDHQPALSFNFVVSFEEGDSLIRDDRGPLFMEAESLTSRSDAMGSFEQWWNAGVLPRDEEQIHNLVPTQNRELLFKNNHGELFLRTATEVSITYTVTRKAWLGYFAPESCRGIVDYLQGGAFFASYLPIGQVPVDRGSDWQEVADLERLAVNIRGTIATTEGWRISEGAGTVPRDAYEWERIVQSF